MSNGMGPENLPWLTWLIHWVILHTRFRKYMAQLDADSVPHDEAWTAGTYPAGGGTYGDFANSNLALWTAYRDTTHSQWFADRSFNAVSYIGYDHFPFVNDAEWAKAQDAAAEFWKGRATKLRNWAAALVVLAQGLGGVTHLASHVAGWMIGAAGLLAGVPWAMARLHQARTLTRAK